MMWYWGGGWHWWDWFVGVVVMLAFWVAVIWAVWFVVGAVVGRRDADRRQRTPAHGRGPSTAGQILDERLARGEIDLGEYRALRDALEGKHSEGTPPPGANQPPRSRPEARVSGD